MKYKPEFQHGFTNPEAVARRCSVKKGILKNFTKFPGKHLYQSLFFNKVEETLSQVFSCQICEISKNTNFYRTYPVAASPNRGYLRCVILKALQAFLEERGLKVKGYAIFSSKCSKWNFQDFQILWKQHEIHQSSLLNQYVH